jgi:hypothetical protein
MIKFVVFESKRYSKNRSFARIHRASCGHAKEPDYKTVSTLCHGYFDEYYKALDFAESLNVGRVYECEFCNPRHANERARKQ